MNPRALKYRVLGAALVASGRLRRTAYALGAFMAGTIVNALADPAAGSALHVLGGVYDPHRAFGWICILATSGAVVGLLAERPIAKLAQQGEYAVRLSDHLSGMIDPSIRDLARGRVAWGTSVVLQPCPQLEAGWRNDEVTVHCQPTPFRFDDTDASSFAAWEADLPADSRLRRGTSYRLTEIPSAFTDDSDLELYVQENRFAEVQFYRLIRASDMTFRTEQLTRTLKGELSFPHSFSLHAVVATTDGWVLATRRSESVVYYPGTWSVSLEEQLHGHDVHLTDERALQVWAARALREELGVPASEAEATDVRAFAVFLEADILNCSLVALLNTPLTRATLDALISRHPRADYEYQEWTFIRWSDFVDELVTPSRDYHPTSGLRMLLAGAAKYGYYRFGSQLDKRFLKA